MGADTLCNSVRGMGTPVRELSLLRPRSSASLGLCGGFSTQTCCSTQDEQRVLAEGLGGMYSVPELLDSDCERVTRRIVCSVCDASVSLGNHQGLCPQLCEEWHRVCRKQWFASEGLENRLVPCAANSLVCTQLDQIVDSGAELCTRAGYTIVTDTGTCYRGDPVLSYTADSGIVHGSPWLYLLVLFGVAVVIVVLWRCGIRYKND
jgi:hypothetical protein